MSIETPNRCEPRQRQKTLRSLGEQVRALHKRRMGITAIGEELGLPRETVLMLYRLNI